MSNAPRVNFKVLLSQIASYQTTEANKFGSVSVLYHEANEREQSFTDDFELTMLDFIKDEIKELLSEIDNRMDFLAEKSPDEVRRDGTNSEGFTD